jgi:hypothetical protein
MADIRTSSEGTAFNMALATLERMNHLLNQATTYSIENQYYQWYKILFSLRRDVFPFLNDDEQKKLNKKFAKIPGTCWQSEKRGVGLDSDYITKVPPVLDEIDLLLREYMKEKGILMPKKLDLNRAIGDM